MVIESSPRGEFSSLVVRACLCNLNGQRTNHLGDSCKMIIGATLIIISPFHKIF